MQNVNFPLGMASFLTLLFYVPTNWLLIYYFDLGLQGAAVALSSAVLLNVGQIIDYLLRWEASALLRQTWSGWSPEALRGWRQFVGMTLWNTCPVG